MNLNDFANKLKSFSQSLNYEFLFHPYAKILYLIPSYFHADFIKIY